MSSSTSLSQSNHSSMHGDKNDSDHTEISYSDDSLIEKIKRVTSTILVGVPLKDFFDYSSASEATIKVSDSNETGDEERFS